MEYNVEVSNAIQNALGSETPPVRHQGLRLMLRTATTTEFEWLWATGWAEPTTCPKYNSWTSYYMKHDHEDKFTGYVNGSVSNGLFPGIMVNDQFFKKFFVKA